MTTVDVGRRVNWREGWKRIAIVLWIAWVLSVALYLPFDAARDMQKVYDADLRLNAENESIATKQRMMDEYRQAIFTYQLAQLVKEPFYWIALAIAATIPPLIVLGVVLGILRIYRWIAGGFAVS